MDDSTICRFCRRKFYSSSNRHRHEVTFHKLKDDEEVYPSLMREVDEIRTLVHQTIVWASGKPLENPHFALRKLTDAIFEMQDPVAAKYAKELPIDKVKLAIYKVFSDNVFNWGRIVAVYAFCAMMTLHNKDNPEALLQLEEHFTTALFSRAGSWFDRHDGWRGFQAFINSNEKKEQLPWTLFNVVASIMIFMIYNC